MKNIYGRRVSIAASLATGLWAILALVGCTEYNEECARFMEDPEGVAGYLAGDISIARSEVRLRDNSVGQVVADSYYNAFNTLAETKRPKVALVNGGSIREDGLCEAKSVLGKGVLRRKTLRDILPFDNRVVLTQVTYKELKGLLEHGVANYSVNFPPGSYPQVSGMMVEVDCSKQAEVLDPSTGDVAIQGERIQSIRLRVRGCVAPEGEAHAVECYGDPIDMTSDESIYIAVDSYLFSGGDNYHFFGEEEASAGTFNFDVVAKYFSKTYPESAPLSPAADKRVILNNCDGKN